jgi:hypothetical protein
MKVRVYDLETYKNIKGITLDGDYIYYTSVNHYEFPSLHLSMVNMTYKVHTNGNCYQLPNDNSRFSNWNIPKELVEVIE